MLYHNMSHRVHINCTCLQRRQYIKFGDTSQCIRLWG